MNDKLERCGSKRSWPNLRYYSGIRLEKLRKTTKNLSQIAGIRAEIWTGTCRIRSRRVNHSTTTFDEICRRLTVLRSKTLRNVKKSLKQLVYVVLFVSPKIVQIILYLDVLSGTVCILLEAGKIAGKSSVSLWTGFIWLKIGSSDGLW
jgi:hypothetical protein